MEIYKDTRTAIKCARLSLKMHGEKVWTSENDLRMFRNFAHNIYVNSNYDNKLLDKYYKVCNKWVRRGQKCNT